MARGYANQEIDGVMSVWLIDWGWQKAKQGSDLRVGDVLMYNYGSTAVVVEVKKETPKTKVFVVETIGGQRYDQRMRKTSWWAVAD